MTKTVAILNWAGHGNFGDELMLEGLRQLFKEWQLVVMSSDEVGAYPLIDFDVVNDCDLFVLGGGELIGTDFLFMPSPSRVHFKIPSCAHRLYVHTPFGHSAWTHHIKIPKVILGCGVNAENASQLKPNVIKDLEQFDYIGLRDNVAVDILSSIPQLKSKVDLFYDLAFAVNTNGSWQHSKDMAVVIPTDRFTYGDKGVRQRCIAMHSCHWLEKKLKPYDKAVFLAFGEKDNNDYETCRLLATYANNSQILNATQVGSTEVLNLIGEATVTFPYRLHGLILSFMTGTKYEFYPYHWKLQRVHDTILGLDLEEIQQKQRTLKTWMHWLRDK